ncbi:hypothetical protein DL98DRAFT_523129 [Cadophora sp. DSE1049]|nr:hypothetical protein DL98DRAFT_523129 [Cadophora sp. DSE1049]
MILELLFIRGTRIRLRVKPPSRELARRGTLAFLRTSRQMLDEASSVFYGKNKFSHHSELGSTRDLLKALGGSLRNLVLDVTGYMDLSELRLLENCQRLQRLHLSVWGVPSGRIPRSIAMPNTLTDLVLSVTERGNERERREKERVKERLGSLLGRRGQALRRSMRLQATQRA